ncbi:MAG: hypothetical protein IJ074_10095 [Clostridia bacterium]|nr:hypothetical protein [Clostridia bacterium]
MFKGLIIKESLRDDRVLDLVNIDGVELWKSGGMPAYWTAIAFTSDCSDLPQRLAQAIDANPSQQGVTWYVDFQNEAYKYIVLADHVLRYRIGDVQERAQVNQRCLELGVREDQLDWSE